MSVDKLFSELKLQTSQELKEDILDKNIEQVNYKNKMNLLTKIFSIIPDIENAETLNKYLVSGEKHNKNIIECLGEKIKFEIIEEKKKEKIMVNLNIPEIKSFGIFDSVLAKYA